MSIGIRHTAARNFFAEAVYGLPELYRDQLTDARLIANPGCYPTSIILALAPLLKAGLIDPGSLIVDSKSGTSGAGRGVKQGTLYCEVMRDSRLMALPVTGIHRKSNRSWRI